jgi:formate dehydrogenase beta subunit
MIFEELKSIQRQHGYLPGEQLVKLSKKIETPLSQIHGVASFYPHFRLTQPARAEVHVCADMACHLRGAAALRTSLEQSFAGTSQKDLSISDVSCLGRCDEAPAISINDRIYSRLSGSLAEALVRGALSDNQLLPSLWEHRPVRCASDPYTGGEKYGALKRLVETRDWDGVLALLKASQLRGLGGAGALTEMKWSATRKAYGREKYIICNADESEPGTFKDRFIMTHLAHLVIEGMIIAGMTTDARHGIVYIRHEYSEQEKIIREEIHRCEQACLLGPRILGSDLGFDISTFVSPGGYICGEETALLEALEGKRAEPRNKPPFPAQQGLRNMPTIVNNVETFIHVPQLVMCGLEHYKAHGTGGASGLKFIGVSGDIQKPGVYEIPMGTRVSELLRSAGGVRDGKQLKAFAPSGPSGGFLPASMADVRLDFNSMAAAGSMLGSGAIVVCAEGTCMLDMALNAVQFYRNESCGKCVPCRVGSQKMVDLLTAWTRGQASTSQFEADLGLVEQLSHTLRLTSICGLGQILPAPVASVLKHFRQEVEAHIALRECPSGVCFSESRARPSGARPA